MARIHSPRRAGFTLIELLVVIAIIGILIAMLVPAVQKVRESAARVQCLNKMKQLGLALHSYHDAKGRFPNGNRTTLSGSITLCTASGLDRTQTRDPWTVQILPYLEEGNLYDKFSLTGTFNAYITDDAGQNSVNRAEQEKPNLHFQCPSHPGDPAAPRNNYYGVMGGGSIPTCISPGNPGWDMSAWVHFVNGILYHNSSTRFVDITDGTSNVFLLGESKYMDARAAPITYTWSYSWASGPRTHGWGWNRVFNLAATYQGINNAADMTGFGSFHTSGCNMVKADGSAGFFSQAMDLSAYRSMGIRNDSLPLGGEF